MSTPEPCPFCGCELQAGFAQDKETVVYWSHPTRNPNTLTEARCPMDKSTIGAKVIDRFWNTPIRLARLGRLHSEVIDGVPVFNEEGRGTPANVTFINECFSYVCLHGGLPNVTGQQP